MKNIIIVANVSLSENNIIYAGSDYSYFLLILRMIECAEEDETFLSTNTCNFIIGPFSYEFKRDRT